MLGRSALAAIGGMTLCACGNLIEAGPTDVTVDIVDAEAPRDGGADDSGPRADASVKKLARPAAGVYEFEVVTGQEHLEPNIYGFVYTAPAALIVEHVSGTDDCLTLTFKLRDNYEETMTMCVNGAELVQQRIARDQLFPLARIKVNLACSPGDTFFVAAPTPNQTWPHHCSGTMTDTTVNNGEFDTKGTYRYVGEEDVAIEPPVKALHFREELLMTGAQTGSYSADFYFAPDGQLVRFARKTDVSYRSSKIGDTNYIEDLDIKLRKAN